jgi:hypothetical protein
MSLVSRFTLVAVAALSAACAAVAPALGGGLRCAQTYSYAGVRSIETRYGVGARISTLRAPTIAAGHVAAWVGVGGSGLGANGSTEWLQAGISAKVGQDPALYYEVARPDRKPRYVMLKAHLALGRPYDVAVLESRDHPGEWRVWVNGDRMTTRIHLPGSHGAWRPMATAESWNDNSGVCNGFSFRFANVQVAATPGGGWQPMRGRVLADAGYKVEHPDAKSLVALGG